MSAVTTAFITYSSLNLDESRLFFSLDLHRYLEKINTLIGESFFPEKIVMFEDLKLSRQAENWINLKVKSVLELIAEHSNSTGNNRFLSDSRSESQHEFFLKRPLERETFYAHLLCSMMFHKMNKLGQSLPPDNRCIEDMKFVSAMSELKTLRGGDRFFYPEQLTETKFKAVGAYYLVELIWQTARESFNREIPHETLISNTSILLKLAQGVFYLTNTIDDRASRRVGVKKTNATFARLHEMTDRVADEHFGRGQSAEEIVKIVEQRCNESSPRIHFYRDPQTAKRRILARWNSDK